MFTTIGVILVTVAAFLVSSFVMVASFAAVLVSELWTLAIQTYHAVNPLLVAIWNWITVLVA